MDTYDKIQDELEEILLGTPPDEGELKKKKKTELKEMCASLELDTSGLKDELVDRILEHYQGQVVEARSQVTFIKKGSEEDTGQGKRI